MKRHAYLVLAHNQYEILQTTLQLLDHKQNDFFIHIDKKSAENPTQELRGVLKESKVIFLDRRSVNWGGYSTIECVMHLLKEALLGEYDYYHLISGVDMPIKTRETILEFFEENEDIQYIHFEQKTIREDCLKKVKTYYWLQEYAKNNRFIYIVGRCLTKLQEAMGVNRIAKATFEFQFGALWFSITKDLADYVVQREAWVKKHFQNTLCADELFLQTLVVNSKFKDKLPETAYTGDYNACLRHIDWKRGNPYVFVEADFQELVESPQLFARKFDLGKDREIVMKLKNYLVERGCNGIC